VYVCTVLQTVTGSLTKNTSQLHFTEVFSLLMFS